VTASKTILTDSYGVGPVVAATVLGYVGDISRFPSRDHFAAYNGTAPSEVSSGNNKIYRHSRRGNRQMNHAVHMTALSQISHPQQRRPHLLPGQDRRRCRPQVGTTGPQTQDQRRLQRHRTNRRVLGQQQCQRLSRRGNRQVNHALHMAALSQIRYPDTVGRTYYDRKIAECMKHKSALRALNARSATPFTPT
jgi:transposase